MEKKPTFLILILILLISVSFADAGTIDMNNPIDKFLQTFIIKYQEWQAKFIGYGRWVFFALAVIDMTLTFGQSAIKGELEFAGIIATLIQKILIYGFFVTLFIKINWLASIPNSGLIIGEQVTGTSITPDLVLGGGLQNKNILYLRINLRRY
ncbi:MAG: hypothetical protein LBG67_05510 [Campylobacteraceae bacterium]|jgi:type IV secretory pathway TrbL component|nr:hypothetical protein [Campylobacteraceae bacterium]